MKGVILAGGTGSRLMPLTRVTNKCLLPLGRKPMILHILDVFLKAGIRDVMLVTSPDHMGHVIGLLGSGAEYGCTMTYKVQDKSNGIAAALGLCESFINGERFAVILGDNIFEDADEPAHGLKQFAASEDDYSLFVKHVPNPTRFGVVKYDADGNVEDIIEKPIVPPSDDAVVGLYCYTGRVFDVIRGLTPSARGEYEISDVNSHMVQNSSGRVYRVDSGWIDAGTFESYWRAHDMLKKRKDR